MNEGEKPMIDTIKCPVCKKRLFDLECQAKTIVKIKCSHCKKVVTIERDWQT